MGGYLCAKFEVSSVILTSFRQGGSGGGRGGNFTSPPPQNEPLKSPPRLGLIYYKDLFKICLKISLVNYCKIKNIVFYS